MGREIERKFLVNPVLWEPPNDKGLPIRQGYLAVTEKSAVRARVMGEQGYLNIKRATLAISRDEYEYLIPAPDAHEMLDTLCLGHLIEKTRYLVPYQGHTWEVDVFHGVNEGLVVAEIELADPKDEFAAPPWVSDEVSHDPRYLNSSLSELPYTMW
ncbi:MAG: CYTH domain-containing protein [Candidatus Hydrogenedentota bacterium]